MTPEGRVKAKVNRVLDTYKDHGLYKFMPVPGGYGKATLDYLCFFHGFGFAIETKRPGGEPTLRQENTIGSIIASGSLAFVIDGENGQLEELEQWLGVIHKALGQQPLQ